MNTPDATPGTPQPLPPLPKPPEIFKSGIKDGKKEETAEKAPVTERAPIVPIFEKIPAIEKPPIVERAPIAEKTPTIEKSPIIEKTPVVEKAPVIEKTPVVEKSLPIERPPVITKAPPLEKAPVIEKIPALEKALGVEKAPGVEKTPVVEKTFPMEKAPAVERIFPIEKAPVIERGSGIEKSPFVEKTSVTEKHPVSEKIPSRDERMGRETVREEKVVPRYIQAPALRDYGLGPRNLFWGIAMLFVALVLLSVALFFAGSQAMISLGTCLLTFTALFVLARMHVFRQRNGGFLALGLVCLLGAVIPLAQSGFLAAKKFVTDRGGSSSAPTVVTNTNPNNALAPEAEPPLLTQSFALSRPDSSSKQVKVIKDSRVLIADKTFLIKAGDLFPFAQVDGNDTAFMVRDLQVTLPSNAVEILDPTAVAKGVTGKSVPADKSLAANAPAKQSAQVPASDDLAEITRSAQMEAMRRYPALAVKDSLENAAFVSTYKQLRDAGSNDFFSNPEWPIELAELLAKREGWARGGSPMTTGPSPVLDAPSNNPQDAPATGPAPRGLLPSVDQLDAGADLPQSRGVR